MEQIIWKDKEGNSYTARKLFDGYIYNILKHFDGMLVSEERATLLDLVKEEAKKRKIERECEYEISDCDIGDDPSIDWD